MERLVKQEPQEPQGVGAGEESKLSAEQWTDASLADQQPQSLILQESPHFTDKSEDETVLLCRHPDLRALQSQLAHLRIENEELRRQLGRNRRGDQGMPAELKWLIYFRAPATKA